MKQRIYKTDSEYESPVVRIQKHIIKMIEDGEILPGERLYSERALAGIYGVPRMTVQNALNGLEQEGYLDRVRGSGTFVRKNVTDKMELEYLSDRENAGMSAVARNQGAKLSSRVLTKGIITGSFFSRRLELDEGAPVYALHRVRNSGGEPVAVEYTYVPSHMFPDINDMDFRNISLYDYMDSMGHMPRKFRQKLMLIEAAKKEREYLELGSHEPVYYFEFTGCDESGKVVEYTESYTRCDKFIYRFEATVQKKF